MGLYLVFHIRTWIYSISLKREFLYVSVSSPQAFEVFGARLSLGQEQYICVGFAFFLFILGRLCVSARITHEGLLFGSGILFGILTVITYPGPGWYFWPLPFLALFCASYSHFHRALFWVFSLLYFLHFYFFTIPPTKIPPFFTVVSFTLSDNSPGTYHHIMDYGCSS